jgi:hypothetical protein
METFGTAMDGEDDEDSDFLDQQQPDQADDFISDDDDFPHQQLGQGDEDYFMSSDDDDHYRSVQGGHDDHDFMFVFDDDEEYPFPARSASSGDRGAGGGHGAGRRLLPCLPAGQRGDAECVAVEAGHAVRAPFPRRVHGQVAEGEAELPRVPVLGCTRRRVLP